VVCECDRLFALTMDGALTESLAAIRAMFESSVGHGALAQIRRSPVLHCRNIVRIRHTAADAGPSSEGNFNPYNC